MTFRREEITHHRHETFSLCTFDLWYHLRRANEEVIASPRAHRMLDTDPFDAIFQRLCSLYCHKLLLKYPDHRSQYHAASTSVHIQAAELADATEEEIQAA